MRYKTLLVAVGPGSSGWAAEIQAALPDLVVRTMRDDVDADAVEYVVMWRLPADTLHTYPNLRGILLMGAGFDHLDLAAMPDVPIVRLVDPAMASDIALYVLSWVIHFQRNFDRFGAAQRIPTWIDDPTPRFPRDVTVGVLGSGAIGSVVLATCAGHGFCTVGWSRSTHDRSLTQFFADCDIVVDLVPLSEQTRHLVGATELEALGDGVLVNVGRGGTVDTDALVAALDGDLRAAVLDVFDDEPLPLDSPLWGRPDVIVTPHIAGRSDPVTASVILADSIRQLRRDETPPHTIPRT